MKLGTAKVSIRTAPRTARMVLPWVRRMWFTRGAPGKSETCKNKGLGVRSQAVHRVKRLQKRRGGGGRSKAVHRVKRLQKRRGRGVTPMFPEIWMPMTGYQKGKPRMAGYRRL